MIRKLSFFACLLITVSCQDALPTAPTATGPVRPRLAQSAASSFETLSLSLVGDATQVGSTVRLTPAVSIKRGAAWSTQKVLVRDGFTATFQFRITSPGGLADLSGADGGDGLAFVVQDQAADAIGNYGQYMGYGGISRSLAVEFDTWQNVGEPDGNHISVQTLGTEPNSDAADASLGSASPGVDLSDGNLHTATIDYTPGTLSVDVDGRRQLSVSVDLGDINGQSILDANGEMWMGLTAATYSAWENHDVSGLAVARKGLGPVSNRPCSTSPSIWQRVAGFLGLSSGTPNTCTLLSALRDPDYFNIPQYAASDAALNNYIQQHQDDIAALIAEIDFGRQVHNFLLSPAAQGGTDHLRGNKKVFDRLTTASGMDAVLDRIVHFLHILSTSDLDPAINTTAIQTSLLVSQVSLNSLNVLLTFSEAWSKMHDAIFIVGSDACIRPMVKRYMADRYGPQTPKDPSAAVADVEGLYGTSEKAGTLGYKCAPLLSEALNIDESSLGAWFEYVYIAYRWVGYNDSAAIREARGRAIALAATE